jgi:hypothetical protein
MSDSLNRTVSLTFDLEQVQELYQGTEVRLANVRDALTDTFVQSDYEARKSFERQRDLLIATKDELFEACLLLTRKHEELDLIARILREEQEIVEAATKEHASTHQTGHSMSCSTCTSLYNQMRIIRRTQEQRV